MRLQRSIAKLKRALLYRAETINLLEKQAPAKIRIGLAVYDTRGFQVLNDDRGSLGGLLKSVAPNVPRGQGFPASVKKAANSIAVMVPTGVLGAGGQHGYVCMCLAGTDDPDMIVEAAKRIMKMVPNSPAMSGLYKIVARKF